MTSLDEAGEIGEVEDATIEDKTVGRKTSWKMPSRVIIFYFFVMFQTW
jgi:hypothetical protein